MVKIIIVAVQYGQKNTPAVQYGQKYTDAVQYGHVDAEKYGPINAAAEQ